MGKKVLILSKEFPQQRLVKWINSFLKRDYEIIVITTKYNKDNNLFNYNVLIKEFVRNDKVDKLCVNLGFHLQIERFLENTDFHPDVVLVRDIFLSKTAIKLKKTYSSKLLLDVADNYPEVVNQLYPSYKMLEKYYNKVEKKAITASDLVITVTTESRKYLMLKHKINLGNKLLVARNIPDFSEKVNEPIRKVFSNESVIKFVYIGKYSIGIRDLKPIIMILNSPNFNFKLYILSKQKQLILNEIKSLNIGEKVLERIHFIEPVENDKLHSFISNYDIGLIPHVRGPATDVTEPNKLYDYIKAGLPILASDNPSLIESVENNDIGVCYSLKKEDSIITSVESIIGKYEKLQTNGHKLIKKLNWENEIKEILNSIY